MNNKAETNSEPFLYEAKYLGRGKVIDLFGAILLFFTAPLRLCLAVFFKSRPSTSDLIWWELLTLPLAIMINIFALRVWPIWPRYVRFYNDLLEFIEADAGPIASRKPVTVSYEDIINVEKTVDEDKLLVYSKDFEKTHDHRDIDLNGMTGLQKQEIIARFQKRNIRIEKDTRMTWRQIEAIMNNKTTRR